MLLQANEEAGAIRPARPGLDDVLLILGFLQRIDLILGFLQRIDPKSDWRSRAERPLGPLMDGLRAGAPGYAR